VQDPHVVAVYDAGRYPGGVYLVMELVRGRSVQEFLGAGPLPWPEATALLIAACEGVVAVHACGILHRDIKPANLLRAAGGIVKLADFGVACRLDPSGRSAACKQLFGTPHYMSPEQWCEEEHDERTDVYALGATYHTVLTGAPPYAGTNPLRIMVGHCAAPVPDPRKGRPEIPAACAEIVLRAMAKQRADRFDSAREFQDALRAVLLGRPEGWRN
jgi:serine/threonine protein kinase